MKIAETIGADTAKLAGLQIDILQKFRNEQITLEHLEWFSRLTKEQRDKFIGNTADSRFKLLNSFELTVPDDYVHETQIASFSKENRKDFYYYHDAITDKNFAKATNKLMPGKTYEVKIFAINQTVSSEDCLAFLEKQNAILVGAQGISVLRQHKKDEFPVGKWTVSFDKKDALWKDTDGRCRVPRVNRHSDGGWYFNLDSFEGGWFSGACLLCFCDL